MEKQKPVCFRCGTCCRSSYAIIPKTEESDLSTDHLNYLEEKYGWDYFEKYFEENSIFLQPDSNLQDEEIYSKKTPCKWMFQEHYEINGKNVFISPSKCMLYNKRSSTCINYKDDIWCDTGIRLWKHHQDNGHKIPDEILELLKLHPDFEKYFPEK